MNSLSFVPARAPRRRVRFSSSPTAALRACLVGLTLLLASGAATPSARAEWIVLNAAGSQSHLVRLNEAGAKLGTLQHETEAYTSLTLSPLNELCVASNILGQHSLQTFDAAGRYTGVVARNVLVGLDGGTRGPDGAVYALGRDGGTEHRSLLRITSATTTTWIAHGTGGMTAPTAFCFGPTGDLYVADASAGILRFDGITGAARGVLVPRGRGGLVEAGKLRFGPDGRLCVIDRHGQSILRFEGTSGAFVDTLVGAGSGGLREPRGLAFGPDGHLYVTSGGTGQILRFDGRTGVPLGVFATTGADPRDPRAQWTDLVFRRLQPAVETVWFDDAVPGGAVTSTNQGGGWTWVSAAPAPRAGTRSHRAYTAGSSVAGTTLEHAFNFAGERLEVSAGDVLFVDVHLDAGQSAGGAILLSWCDGNWEHRAYWGENLVKVGTSGTASRRYMGPLPDGPGWQRLEVPARLLGLEGRSLQGVSFTVVNTLATFDRVGKVGYEAGAPVTPTTPPAEPTAPPPVDPPSPTGVTLWFDDALPAGAVAGTTQGDWRWITAGPTPASGLRAHQSPVASGLYEHFFNWAYAGAFRVERSDTLVVWVYPDPAHPPRQLMLSWRANTWEHRAYWGDSLIGYGQEGSVSRRRLGDVPPAGRWTRLEIPAEAVGLGEGALLGMSFGVYGGRATWDAVGKRTAGSVTPPADLTLTLTSPAVGALLAGEVLASATVNSPDRVALIRFTLNETLLGTDTTAPFTTRWQSAAFPNGSHLLRATALDTQGQVLATTAATVTINNPAAGGAVVWMDSAVPAGAWTGASGGDAWTWVTTNPTPQAGTRVHQSADRPGLHEHYFTGATSPLDVSAGDVLFVYVYLHPASPPRSVMVSWFDGTWEHRAYWGEDRFPYGVAATASRRRMGPLPVTGQWIQLQVPAAQVGLEGRSVRGMSFSLFDGQASWDVAGKVGR